MTKVVLKGSQKPRVNMVSNAQFKFAFVSVTADSKSLVYFKIFAIQNRGSRGFEAMISWILLCSNASRP